MLNLSFSRKTSHSIIEFVKEARKAWAKLLFTMLKILHKNKIAFVPFPRVLESDTEERTSGDLTTILNYVLDKIQLLKHEIKLQTLESYDLECQCWFAAVLVKCVVTRASSPFTFHLASQLSTSFTHPILCFAQLKFTCLL